MRHRGAFSALAAAALLSLLGGGLGRAAERTEPARTVYRARIEGVINPFSARYLQRAIREAERAGGAALVLELDTPGGLDSAMRAMIQAEMNSHVPVIVYVSPSGARAASAGMFVTLASHLAAMAPGTAIGAASPVSLTGGGGEGETLKKKITEDAAAMARSLAEKRGRNVEWAEAAVRDAVSLTETEAKRQGVIEIVSSDLVDLLQQADGMTVKTPSGETILRVAGAPVEELPMSFLERLLQVIADPNIAYILLTIGTLGVIVELYNPGALFPGIAGVICLLLGLAAMGTLPVGYAGAALLVVAVGLLLAELHAPGFGAFGTGALIAFLAGSLLLFVPVTPPSPAAPVVSVSPWLIGGMTALFFGVMLLVAQRVWAVHRLKPWSGAESLVGVPAQAVSALAPEGTVRIHGEVWSARSEAGPIGAGAKVRVVRTEGVVVVVAPAAEEEAPPDRP